MHKRYPVTIIRRSCLTDNAVWIYRGPTHNAARKAYWIACKAEVERVEHWREHVALRTANISRLLSECLAEIPINAELTPEQKKAVRQLQSLMKKGIACHMEFYEHIMEQRRRREEDREIRRQMREREKKL